MTESDKKAAFLLLELAELGRPVEQVAQFLASWLMSSEIDQDDVRGFMSDMDKIQTRFFYLYIHPEEIWEGLLPGGPGDTSHYKIVDDRTEPKMVPGSQDIRTVMIVGRPHYGMDWIVFSLEGDAMWSRWYGTIYNNVSHSDSDQLSRGMTIEVMDHDLVPLATEEVADLLLEVRA